MNRKNFTLLEGNLVANPNFRTFKRKDEDGAEKDVAVCDFTVACNGGRDGHSNEVCFINCEAWAEGAQRIAEYQKGDCLHLTGNLKNKEWVDKNTNEKRSKLIFRVEHFIPVKLKEPVAL